MADLLDEVLLFCRPVSEVASPGAVDRVVALVGRPNVGKEFAVESLGGIRAFGGSLCGGHDG